jgi:hypothetical protein
MINLVGITDARIKVRVSGRRVSLPLGEYLMIKFLYKGTSYTFVGTICTIDECTLSFDVCAAQSSSAMFKFNISVSVLDLVSIRVMGVRDVPLMINWSWIGLGIRRKYFGGVI